MWFGCAFKPRPQTDEAATSPAAKRVVFLGFKPALSPGSSPDVVRSPISGSLFAAEPVPPEAIDRLNAMLTDRLVQLGDEVLSSEETRGVYSGLMKRGPRTGLTTLEAFGEFGKSMDAYGVLVGHIYRWQQREGADYAVERPASAAFDLNLIRSSDSVLVWRGKFDKTQRSLSENILDFMGFFKRGGRWIKVEDFALSGLDDLLKDYSSVSPGEK
jgi:hypothetical protein